RGRDVVRGEYRDALEDPDAFVDLALRGDAGTEEDPAQQIGQVAETTLGGEDLFARDEPSLAPDELLGPDDPHVPIARAASAGHAKLEEVRGGRRIRVRRLLAHCEKRTAIETRSSNVTWIPYRWASSRARARSAGTSSTETERTEVTEAFAGRLVATVRAA